MKTAAGSIISNNMPARLLNFSKQVDWEAELDVVIGKKIRNISEQNAFDAVAGYRIVVFAARPSFHH